MMFVLDVVGGMIFGDFIDLSAQDQNRISEPSTSRCVEIRFGELDNRSKQQEQGFWDSDSDNDIWYW